MSASDSLGMSSRRLVGQNSIPGVWRFVSLTDRLQPQGLYNPVKNQI